MSERIVHVDVNLTCAPVPSQIDSSRPLITINGQVLTDGEVDSLRVAATSFHSEMADPDALGADETGRMMTKSYRRNMTVILRFMGVTK